MAITKEQRDKIVNFFKLKNIFKVSKWDDLKEGETYHVPPLLVLDRFDFNLIEKKDNLIRVKKNGCSTIETIYKTDILTNFIVKIKHGTNTPQKTLC